VRDVPLCQAIHVRWDQIGEIEKRLDRRKAAQAEVDLSHLFPHSKGDGLRHTRCDLGEIAELEVWIAYLGRTPLQEIREKWGISNATIYAIKYARVAPHALYLCWHEDVRAKLYLEAQEELRRIREGFRETHTV